MQTTCLPMPARSGAGLTLWTRICIGSRQAVTRVRCVTGALWGIPGVRARQNIDRCRQSSMAIVSHSVRTGVCKAAVNAARWPPESARPSTASAFSNGDPHPAPLLVRTFGSNACVAQPGSRDALRAGSGCVASRQATRESAMRASRYCSKSAATSGWRSANSTVAFR